MSFLTETKQKQKASQTPTYTPMAQSLLAIMARYLLQSMYARQQNPAMNFANFRAGTPNSVVPTVLGSEGMNIPGVGAPPVGVNPILANYASQGIGLNQPGGGR